MIWSRATPKFRAPILFLIGGGLNTAFSYFIYLGLQHWLGYQLAYFIGYFLGIILAYWFNTTIVFKASLSWKSLFSYPVVYIVQYIISAVFMGTMVERFGVAKDIAPLLVIIVMIPATYMMNKLVVGWAREKIN